MHPLATSFTGITKRLTPHLDSKSSSHTTKAAPTTLACLFMLLPAAVAQGTRTAAASPSSPQAPGDQEAVQLSPFIVSEDAEQGYHAQNTLAGTRLKSSLDDIASSVQVVTTQFLDDTGVTNLQELLVYTTNTEIGGDGGNFSGLPGLTDIRTDDITTEPHLTNRIRGLFQADLTRDYFKTVIPTDSYNTSRVEINRGSNAVLFGLGSPAGIINTGLIKADFKNRGKVKIRIGEQSSLRSELDINRVIMPDKLSLRVAGVTENHNYRQRPAYEDHDRMFLAGTWRPGKNITVRASYETGRIRANRPENIAPKESISSWLLAGKPLYHSGVAEFTPDKMPFIEFPDGRRVPYNGVRVDLDGDGVLDVVDPANISANNLALTILKPDGTLWNEGQFLVDANGNVTAPPFARMPGAPFTRIPINNARIQSHTMAVWSDTSSVNPDTVGFQGQSNGTYHVNGDALNGLLGRAFDAPLDPAFALGGDGVNESSLFYSVRNIQEAYSGFGGRQGFVSNAPFDFAHNLLAGTTSFQEQDFESFNTSVEQTFFKNAMGFELAYDKQSYFALGYNPFQVDATSIKVDINLMLPDGRFNPNVGRPYIYSRGPLRQRTEDQETLRATGFFELDFKRMARDGWARRLGRHVFTVFANNQKNDRFSVQRFQGWDDAALMRAGNSSTNIRSFGNQPAHLLYVGPSLLDVPAITDLAQLGDMQLPPLQRMDGAKLWRPTDVATVQFWDPGVRPGTVDLPATTATGSDVILANGKLVEKTISFGEAFGGDNLIEEEIDSYAVVAQSYLLDDVIVGTVGFRSDEVVQLLYNTPTIDNLGRSIPSRLKEGGASETRVKAERWSWGVVGHLPDRIRLPFGSKPSLHYSESSNFQPVAGLVDYKNRPIGSPNGETTEKGVSLSMFGGKLFARLNFYETGLVGRPTPAGEFDGVVRLNHVFNANAAFQQALAVEVDNPELAALNRSFGLTLINSLSEGEKDRLNPFITYDDNGIPVAADHNREATARDTDDVIAKGKELEVVYSPNPNWRFMLNVGQQETIKANSYSHSYDELVAERAAIAATPIPGFEWLTMGEAAASGTSLNAGTFDLPNQVYQLNPGVQTAAAAFSNRMSVFREARLLDGTTSTEQREWRVNFVANYSFTEGKLKGLGLGGGYRWQSEAVIGYASMTTEDGIVVSDVSRPFLDHGRKDIDLWARYKLPLFRKYFDWSLQLNVRNAFTSADEVIGVRMQGDGVTPERVTYAPPRAFFLTSTFEF